MVSGALGAPRGCWELLGDVSGVSGGVGGASSVWGAGRECRYSGVSRYRWHKGVLGLLGVVGCC